MKYTVQKTTCLVFILLATALSAQDYGTRLGNIQRGGKVSFEPTGPGVLFDALDPAVRKWYVSQELYAEYQWQQFARIRVADFDHASRERGGDGGGDDTARCDPAQQNAFFPI